MQIIELNNRNFNKVTNGKSSIIFIEADQTNITDRDFLIVNADTNYAYNAITTQIYTKLVSQLTDKEAEMDGFNSVQELKNDLAMRYTRVIKEHEKVTVILFKLVESSSIVDFKGDDELWLRMAV